MRFLPPLMLVLAVLPVSFADVISPPAPNAASNAGVSTAPAVDASNLFACDLLRRLAEEQPDEGQFFSPWSVSSALAMALEGARKNTALEMGQVLRLPAELRQQGDRPWKLDSYHGGFALLQRSLQTGDDRKNQAKRLQIARLRKELDAANSQLRQLDPERAFAAQNLSARAQSLADTINNLDQEVDLFELRQANAIWVDKQLPYERSFMTTVDRYYGTGMARVADFAGNFPAERRTINRWVEEQTKNRIRDLIPDVDGRDMAMILVNAIYFKGEWSEPFHKESTRQEPFTQASGNKVTTPLMHQTATIRYGAFRADGSFFATPHVFFPGAGQDQATYPGADGFLMAELPYKGNKLAMVVIAPQSPDGLPRVMAKFTGENLKHWLSQLECRSVNVTMPKFKMDTSYELNRTLSELGMADAFKKFEANFQGIAVPSNPAKNLYISTVLHKAFVEVNEKGTEAAAATAVMMALAVSAAPIGIPFTPDFRADRPFLFLIRDVNSGAILFAGRMLRPVVQGT